MDINSVIPLQAAAGELLQELRTSDLQALAWPHHFEELEQLTEAFYEKITWAAQLREYAGGPPAAYELRQALDILARMLQLATTARMPVALIEDMGSLRFGIQRVRQGP